MFNFALATLCSSWVHMRYPMKKRMRVRLGALFYELAVMPGLDPDAIGMASDMVRALLKYVILYKI